jgi:cell division protein FtsN
MIEVGAYPTRSQAELAQAALAMAGIPSTLEADDGAHEYRLDVTEAVRLLVDEAEAEAAVAVLSDHRHETRREKP